MAAAQSRTTPACLPPKQRRDRPSSCLAHRAKLDLTKGVNRPWQRAPCKSRVEHCYGASGFLSDLVGHLDRALLVCLFEHDAAAHA